VAFLTEARDVLDCSSKGRCHDSEATFACPRCVLSADSQHLAEETDRKLAHQLLTSAAARLALPEEAKLFGEATAYEAVPLADAVSEYLVHDPSAELVVPMSGNPTEWDLDGWSMTPVLERWGARGRTPMVIVDAASLAASDPVTRRQFVLWAQRARVTVRSADKTGLPRWIACVVGPMSTTVWSSGAATAREIGLSWAATSEAPVVRGKILRPTFGPGVDLASLIASGRREALLEIERELDGPATGFGTRLRSLLTAKSPELGRLLSAKVLSLTYSDRYLFSPLVVRLATELVAGFADTETEVKVITLSVRPDGRARPGRWIYTDWPDFGLRLGACPDSHWRELVE